MRRTVISPRVRVPVLSEQMTVVQPRVSTAGILRTRAFLRAIWRMPMARAPVTMAARASGTAATAREMANMTTVTMNWRSILPSRAWRRMLTPATRPQMPRARSPSHLPISSVRFSRGVFSVATAATSRAMAPKAVCMPVSTTRARPRP